MRARSGYVIAAGAAAGHWIPSVSAIGPLRLRLWPALSGVGDQAHVAITFDDGPDARTTPRVLETLAELQVRATFFVLGNQLNRHPDVARRAVAEGHELAVHGWLHTPHLLRTPRAVHRDLARAAAAVRELTGVRPRYWRPPHGIVTGAGLWAARRQGLRPVLWTADGQDWFPDATAESVSSRIVGQLRPGAVVLLHDSDAVAPHGTALRAAAALATVVEACRQRGWTVGPLGQHGLRRAHAYP